MFLLANVSCSASVRTARLAYSVHVRAEPAFGPAASRSSGAHSGHSDTVHRCGIQRSVISDDETSLPSNLPRWSLHMITWLLAWHQAPCQPEWHVPVGPILTTTVVSASQVSR